ncbi:MAG: hypothetical protein H6917_08090 [Novosphingobium sp.]|nr:hypothetical protein [Novosphingobium sp.]
METLRCPRREHDQIDRFQVAGGWAPATCERPIPSEVAIGQSAEVVFHVTNLPTSSGLALPPGEFVEDDLGAGHHIREHVEPAAMRHAEHVSFTPSWPPYLMTDSAPESSEFPAVQPAALGADILLAEILLVLLASDHGRKDRLHLPITVKSIDLSAPIAGLEAALLGHRDVHMYSKADHAAMVRAQDFHQILKDGDHSSQIAATAYPDPDLRAETVIFRGVQIHAGSSL